MAEIWEKFIERFRKAAEENVLQNVYLFQIFTSNMKGPRGYFGNFWLCQVVMYMSCVHPSEMLSPFHPTTRVQIQKEVISNLKGENKFAFIIKRDMNSI